MAELVREQAIARCHQRNLPVVDAVGRRLVEGSRVACGRNQNLWRLHVGKVLFLFDFDDFHPPEIEVELDAGGIICHSSRLTGGCWKFDSLLLSAAAQPLQGEDQ